MSANNGALMIGRVGKDPETKTAQTGTTVTSFSLAVGRHQKDKDGKELTDWFSVVLFGKQAELAETIIHKGDLIAVEGSINIDEWTDREGQRQKMVKLVGSSFQQLTPKDARENAHGPQEGRQQAGAAQSSRRQPAPRSAPAQQAHSAQASGGDGAFYDEDDIPPF